jgi:hypothetical protein
MKQAYRCSQNLGKFVLLVVMAVGCARPSSAQQDLQVMVAGPWSYVTDSVKYPGRLFLVAPGSSTSHAVYIFPGTNPVFSSSNPPVVSPTAPSPTGTYKLDYSYKGQYSATDQSPPVLCGAAISSPTTNVRPILNNASNSNFVISLPIPDGYSTFSGSINGWSGTSESEVSGTPILNSTAAPPARQYTTWMVLHYGVTQIPASFQLTGTAVGTISTTGSTANYSGGISIVLSDMGTADLVCDSVSLVSVKDRNGLWTLNQYARFPRQSSPGVQILGQYDFSHCSNSGPVSAMKNAATHSKVSAMKQSKPGLLSPGSADCHACQMSVNSAIPGAITPTVVGK